MPNIWLLILLALAVAAFVVVLPRIKEWWESRQREQIEDALKHMLDREQQGRHASPESLAGALKNQKQYEEQQIKYMRKRAAKLGYQLTPVPA